MSPSASRKRIFDAETSGKSARSSASTLPMVSRRSDPLAARLLLLTSTPPAPGGSGRVVDETELADLHLVAGVQRGLVDALPVDVGAVERPGVTHEIAVVGTDEQRVLARDGHVIEEDVGVGVAAGCDL